MKVRADLNAVINVRATGVKEDGRTCPDRIIETSVGRVILQSRDVPEEIGFHQYVAYQKIAYEILSGS